MTGPTTNLRILKRSRNIPLPGDVFVMQLPDEDFIFGRVIEADIQDPTRAPMPGSYLIYVYTPRRPTMEPPFQELTPRQLLISPMFINRMPWTKGFFEKVAHAELGPGDRLARHCFWSAGRQTYVDEFRNPLVQRSEPCGDWALSSYRLLDDRVSDALGMPRAPE